MITVNETTREFLSILHRGGTHSYWWTAPHKRSLWWLVERPTTLPNGRSNVYFGVHPVNEIPSTNAQDEPKPPESVRSQIRYIATVNALFGEFDAKRFGDSKEATFQHIEALSPTPPVIIDSGGGYHCYWLLDEPYHLKDDAARKEAADLQVRWVAYVGSDDGAKDLARVLRVPGTKNYKYDPAPEVQFVRCDLDLRYTIEELDAACKTPTPRQFDTTQPQTVEPDYAAYAQAAFADELARLARATEGDRNTQLNKSAFALAQFFERKLLDENTVRTTLEGVAKSIGLTQREIRETIRSGFDAGRKEPRELPERQTTTTREHIGKHHGEPNKPIVIHPQTIELEGLLNKKFDPVRWVIPGFLPEGVTILGAKPKIGKSWMVHAWALAIASGGRVFGSIRVDPGDVLYLALEDNPRRLKTRSQILLNGQPAELQAALTLSTAWPRADEGGIEALEQWLQDHPNARLVIVDTLVKFRPKRKRCGDIYDEDYEALVALKALSDRYHVAIVVVHHLRKATADDPLDTLLGTTGLAGSVDGALILRRERTSPDAIMFVGGREIENEREVAMRFDTLTAQWVMEGDAGSTGLNLEQRKILRTLRDAGEPLTIQGILDRTEGLKANSTYVRQLLSRMLTKDVVVRTDRGKYTTTTTTTFLSQVSQQSQVSQVSQVSQAALGEFVTDPQEEVSQRFTALESEKVDVCDNVTVVTVSEQKPPPPKQSDFDHDQQLKREVEASLRQGDKAGAKRAAERIRGNRMRDEVRELIAQYEVSA